MQRNRTKGAILVLVAIAAMLALPSAQSLPGGISGRPSMDATTEVEGTAP